MNQVTLVVAGHGGLNALGEYPRRDKRSPEVPPGIYEGEFTRTTGSEMVEEIQEEGMIAQLVNPGPVNQPHRSLVGFINDTVRRSKDPVCVFELHANSNDVKSYDEDGWYDENGEDNETGYTIFISRKASKTSRRLAEVFDQQLQAEGYEIPSRGIKEANFQIITRTTCPAILIECGFMSNLSDVAKLQQKSEIKKLCRAAVNTLKIVYSV